MRKLLLVLRFLLLSLCAVVTAGIFAATLAAFLPQSEYLIDQLSQLRLGYVLALAILLVLFLALRSRWFAALACLGILLNILSYAAFFMPGERKGKGPAFTIMSANIYGQRNYNYAALIELVRERTPDILCLEETTPQWTRTVKLALPEYAFIIDQQYAGGSVLLSKIPIEREQTVPGIARFGVRGTLQLRNMKALLIVSHPPAPTSTRRWDIRNIEFRRLTEDVLSSTLPVIIIGDFNSTPWSSYFQQLLGQAKLEDSEVGFGIQPSWSTLMPLPMVPIDHCVYTHDFATVSRQVGPNIHSDHLPLFVELTVR